MTVAEFKEGMTKYFAPIAGQEDAALDFIKAGENLFIDYDSMSDAIDGLKGKVTQLQNTNQQLFLRAMAPAPEGATANQGDDGKAMLDKIIKEYEGGRK